MVVPCATLRVPIKTAGRNSSLQASPLPNNTVTTNSSSSSSSSSSNNNKNNNSSGSNKSNNKWRHL